MSDPPRGKRPLERIELDRLYDIQKAIEEIHGHPRFPEGKAAWDEDKYFRGYCERQLGIVGEAASKLAADHGYEGKDPATPWRLIKGLRNIVVHLYWKTDKQLLWSIIDENLPELKQKVDGWIKDRELALKDTDIPPSAKRESKLLRKLRQEKSKDEERER